MESLTHRRLLIAVPLAAILLIAVAFVFMGRGANLKARSSLIAIGMPRDQVELILGPPALVLRRQAGKGTALVWTDQLWQLDVYTGPDGRVESINHVPSDSLLRRSVGAVVTLPKK